MSGKNKPLFRESNVQGWHPFVDHCAVCGKDLVGRGTKYLFLGRYLCREHAKEEGIRVFRSWGQISIKSKLE